MAKDDFISWLENTTDLSSYSINRYANAIETLSRDGLSEKNLYSIADKQDIENILNNPAFQEKNKRGNRMYSAALNHYIGYIDYCNKI